MLVIVVWVNKIDRIVETMKNIQESLKTECYGRNIQERRHWYSPAAKAYQKARPRYPKALIEQVIKTTGLSGSSTILEIGCGPAIATPAFAELGCRMICIEPNPDFYHLARQECEIYPNVELINCSFEEWEPQGHEFDVVLAASSFHWVSPEIGYPKAAKVLRPEGFLILLWNKELQPAFEVYQRLIGVYQKHTPSAMPIYEDMDATIAVLGQLAQIALESGCFKDMRSGYVKVEVRYSVDEYLMLLSTYSPYLKLKEQEKQALFGGLGDMLSIDGNSLELSYISAFHIGRPIK
ncbi:MAG: hypothetical protein N5P05_004373 (plasmid) [Chroococcopsis gigantea SAG 12.99]|jgi:SAM-dependent methyltransferase|nr:hypothetical protein [Chroococcopsis gigantea SAG 12.99]